MANSNTSESEFITALVNQRRNANIIYDVQSKPLVVDEAREVIDMVPRGYSPFQVVVVRALVLGVPITVLGYYLISGLGIVGLALAGLMTWWLIKPTLKWIQNQ